MFEGYRVENPILHETKLGEYLSRIVGGVCVRAGLAMAWGTLYARVSTRRPSRVDDALTWQTSTHSCGHAPI
jgi:hypothetical protein